MTGAGILVVAAEAPMADFMEKVLVGRGYAVTLASDGESAWRALSDTPQAFQAILLDQGLPGMAAMTLLRRLKQSPGAQSIPVIMATPVAAAGAVRAALTAGAVSFLVKPVQEELLLAVIAATVQYQQQTQALRSRAAEATPGLQLIQRALFSFHTLEEAHQVAHTVAGAFPDPGRVIHGLLELLINAIEHGNLGISYEEKGALILADRWHAEVDRRLALPEHRDKRVEVRLERRPHTVEVTIRDQGQGFNWVRYLTFDPERALDPHGRGIAMAHALSFDTLDYIGNGSVVQVAVNIDQRAPG